MRIHRSFQGESFHNHSVKPLSWAQKKPAEAGFF